MQVGLDDLCVVFSNRYDSMIKLRSEMPVPFWTVFVCDVSLSAQIFLGMQRCFVFVTSIGPEG